MPQSDVHVITGEVGGSFGMKSGIYPEMVLVLWAAKRLGRPVKWTSERREGFLTDEHGRDNVSSVELALDAQGKFLGMRVALMVDIGAYLTPRSAGPGHQQRGRRGGRVHDAGHPSNEHGRVHQHHAHRAVSRGGAPGGNLRHRARHRRGRP